MKKLILLLALTGCAQQYAAAPAPEPAVAFNALAQGLHGVADATQQNLHTGPYALPPPARSSSVFCSPVHGGMICQ